MKFKSFNRKTKTFWDHLLNISFSIKEFRYILFYESYIGIYVVIKFQILNDFVLKLDAYPLIIMI